MAINENADPKVLLDLNSYLKAIVPEEGFKPISGEGKKKQYSHSSEGVDDMPAHIRTALTNSCLSLSIDNGQLALGIWQAVYLWEHRYAKHSRVVNLHAIGEIKQTTKRSSQASTSTLLSHKNGLKLNKLIRQEIDATTLSEKLESSTNVDLLIDRLHELAGEEPRSTNEPSTL